MINSENSGCQKTNFWLWGLSLSPWRWGFVISWFKSEAELWLRECKKVWQTAFLHWLLDLTGGYCSIVPFKSVKILNFRAFHVKQNADYCYNRYVYLKLIRHLLKKWTDSLLLNVPQRIMVFFSELHFYGIIIHVPQEEKLFLVKF